MSEMDTSQVFAHWTELLSHYTLTEEAKRYYGFPYVDMANQQLLTFYQKYSRVHRNVSTCSNYVTLPCGKLIQQAECERCSKIFRMEMDWTYITQEVCLYHWGKLKRQLEGGMNVWTCCSQPSNTSGCSVATDHVWRGLFEGYNILADLQPGIRYNVINNPPSRAYGIACNMVYTNYGVELAEIVLVDLCGDLIFGRYVRPTGQIVDCNTRFSGIREEQLTNACDLSHVREDIKLYLNEETLLIGHSLEDDLRALRMSHKYCVDLTTLYPHRSGYPRKNSLNVLTKRYLNKRLSERRPAMERANAIVELALAKINDRRVQ